MEKPPAASPTGPRSEAGTGQRPRKPGTDFQEKRVVGSRAPLHLQAVAVRTGKPELTGRCVSPFKTVSKGKPSQAYLGKLFNSFLADNEESL